MNRYLLRSLVAVITFSIGVALGSLGSRHERCSEKQRYRYREGNFKHELRVNRAVAIPENHSRWSGPSISVDSLLTDPLKLTYSSTTPSTTDLGRQKVEFAVANNTKREVANFGVSYRSRWRSNQHGGGGGVTVYRNIEPNGLDVVAIECSGDESVAIWISSIEFKDGSRWSNNRH